MVCPCPRLGPSFCVKNYIEPSVSPLLKVKRAVENATVVVDKTKTVEVSHARLFRMRRWRQASQGVPLGDEVLNHR